MPYKRKYKRRTYRKKRSAWGYCSEQATKAGANYLASQALRGVNYLKGLVNSEKFKHNRTWTDQILVNSGAVSHITNISQGDGEGQRTGNSIYIRSINGRFYVKKNVGVPYTLATVWLVIDKQQITDTAPTFSQIFERAYPTTLLNDETVGRFTILFKKMIKLDDVNSSSAFSLNKVLRHHVRYNGSANTDQQKGALYLVWVSDQSTDQEPTMNADLRISYHDN